MITDMTILPYTLTPPSIQHFDLISVTHTVITPEFCPSITDVYYMLYSLVAVHTDLLLLLDRATISFAMS